VGHVYHKGCIKGIKECPYCGKKVIIKEIVEKKCEQILKSGKIKSSICGRNNCKIHKNKDNKIDVICNTILKTGKNKGNICGRINCKLHSKDSLNI